VFDALTSKFSDVIRDLRWRRRIPEDNVTDRFLGTHSPREVIEYEEEDL